MNFRFPVALIAASLLPLVFDGEAALAVEGFMVRITADEAPIRIGEKTVGTAPKGTRLWAFEVKDGTWAQVKAPESEVKGWLYHRHYETVRLTLLQKARKREAYRHYERHKVLRDEKKFAEAVEEMKRCLAIEEEVFGPVYPDVAASHSVLGLRYTDLDKHDLAVESHRKAREIRKALLGERHSKTLLSMHLLGKALWELGKHDEAEEILTRTVLLRAEVLGAKHKDTKQSQRYLGYVAAAIDRRTKADSELHPFEGTFWSVGRDGETHPVTEGYMATTALEDVLLEAADSEQTDLRLAKGTRLWITSESGDQVLARQSHDIFAGWVRAGDIRRIELPPESEESFLAINRRSERQEQALDERGVITTVDELLEIWIQSASDRADLHRKHLGEDHPLYADKLLLITRVRLSLLGHEVAQGKYEDFGAAYSELTLNARKVLGIYQQWLPPKHISIAGCRAFISNLLHYKGDAKQANLLLGESAADYMHLARQGNKVAIGDLYRLAWQAQMQQQTALARQCREVALEALASAGADGSELARAYSSAANQAAFQHDNAAAESLLFELLQSDWASQSISKTLKGELRMRSGLLAMQRGDALTALDHFSEHLDVCLLKHGDLSRQAADAKLHVAFAYSTADKYPEGIRYAAEALETVSRLYGDNHHWCEEACKTLAYLYAASGDARSARFFSEKALRLAKLYKGNYKTEESKLHGKSELVGLLADALRSQGETTSAIEQYDLAIRLQAKSAFDAGGATPGYLSLLRRSACARAIAGERDAALDNADKVAQGWREFMARQLVALPDREQSQYLDMMRREVIDSPLSLIRHSISESKATRLGAEWQINLNGLAGEAVRGVRRLKTAHNKDSLEKLTVKRSELARLSGGGLTPNQAARYEELLREIDRLTREIGSSPGASINLPWIETAELTSRLPKDSVLVTISRFTERDLATDQPKQDRYVAWVLRPESSDHPAFIDLGEAPPIDKAVAACGRIVGQSASDVDKEGVESALGTLSDLVWRPLSPHVGGSESVYLSPAGSLWLAPWAALPDQKGAPLVESHRLSLLVSGRELLSESTAPSSASAVVFADPNFDARDNESKPEGLAWNVAEDPFPTRSATGLRRVGRLPGTAREAEKISPLLARLSPSSPVVHLGAEATEERFKALQSPRVLTLSTHGFFLPKQEVHRHSRLSGLSPMAGHAVRAKSGLPLENPLLRCGLLLAGANHAKDTPPHEEDGVLTGLEILDTDLQGTELVVLSACDTGLGDVRNGEGVAGLRQAFQLAGAESVVSTLWQIPDEETVNLMTSFFEHLADGKSKSEALRQAQLDQIALLRKRDGYAHPYYWAAFTFTGVDRPMKLNASAK